MTHAGHKKNWFSMGNNLILLVVISLVLSLLFVQVAEGSPLLYPRQPDNTNVNSSVAISSIGSGPNWGLSAPVTRYRVMSTDSTPTVTIEYACEGDQHGANDLDDADYEFSNGVSQTRWTFYHTRPTDNRRTTAIPNTLIHSATERNLTSGNICSLTLRPRARTLAAASQRSQVPGYTQFYVFEIQAQEINHQTANGSGTPGNGAGKGFRIRVNTGHVTPVDVYTYNYTNPLISSNSNIAPPPSSLGTVLLGRLRSTGPKKVNYTFTFSPDCRIQMPGNGSGVNILMFWYDMDVGISPNTDGTERLTIRDETGAVVRMRPRRSSADGSSSWNSTGNFLTALTGANLNGGFSGASGGSKYGVAEFNVKRDSTYTVTFANMEYSSNALEVYLPFADYNGTWQCPQPLHNIERAIGSCNVIGYYYYPLNRSEKYTVNLQFRLGTSGAWSSTLTDLANRTGSQYGAGSGNGFTRAPPANLLSATQNLYVRAWVIYNGVQDTLTNLTTGLNLGICGTWDLRPAITGNPPPSAVFPKPGSSLTISTVVRNWGDSASSNYTLERRVVSGGGILTNASTISSSHGALAAGASISAVTRNYTIRPDAADGSTVCFESRVSPMTNTNSGWRNSNRICYTIYNERFDLNLVITMPTQAFPGQNIDISYSVCNQSDDELNLIAPAPGTASRGDSPPTTITTSGALNPGLTNNTNQTITNGNCWDNFNRTVQIPASAVVGDTLCTTLTSNRNHGFSDGTGLGGHPVSLQECLVIADGPYLQVLGHDTWAGGAFARNGSCNVTGSGNITSLTTANLTSSGTVGALDQYAAFARGDLSGFGTAGNAGGSSLTFANTGTPLGRFGANNRCLYDLFDNGGAGGSIDDALWNNAADESNLNSIGQNQEGQLRISGATTYSSSGSPFNNFRGNATILINGNFDIRRDIILNNSLSMGDVPFLVFVVAGDIRIQNDVNRLDGIYIALGQVDTCSTFGSGSLSPFTDLTANPPCNQHLRINGSLIANDIALRRTHGGTNEASTGNNLNRCLPGSTPAPLNSRDRRCAAETIIFPPWFYLADPFFDRGSSSLIEDYRIQQIRDLPPIF